MSELKIRIAGFDELQPEEKRCAFDKLKGDPDYELIWSPLSNEKLVEDIKKLTKNSIQIISAPQIFIEEKKRFIVGAPARTGENFIVPFDKLSLPKLLLDAESGGCRLVQGPYRSSKTSHLIALIDELKIRGIKYIVLYFLDNTTIESLVNQFRQLYPQIPEKTTFFDALNFVPVEDRLLILWDEFQFITRIKEEDKQDILRGLKQSIPASGRLRGCLAFGTYQTSAIVTLDDISLGLSPFHGKDTITIQKPTAEQLFVVLEQWRKQNNFLRIGNEILESVVSMSTTTSPDGKRFGYIGISESFSSIIRGMEQQFFEKDRSFFVYLGKPPKLT